MQKTLLVSLLIVVGVSAMLSPVFAAKVECKGDPAEGIPPRALEAGGLLAGVDPCCVVYGQCTIRDFAITLFNIGKWIVGISASIALAFIVFSGGMLIFSGGNTGRIDQGKKMLQGSIAGLAIILLSWVIINFVVASFTGTDGTIFDSKRWDIIS